MEYGNAVHFDVHVAVLRALIGDRYFSAERVLSFAKMVSVGRTDFDPKPLAQATP